MALRTITGTILGANGSPVRNGEVSFRMMDDTYLTDPDETYVLGTVKTRTDANGEFSIELPAGLPILWLVRLPGGEEFVVAVPEGMATTLEFLRAEYDGTAPERVPGLPPTVTDFTNMQHGHLGTTSGGALTSPAIRTALGFLPQRVFNAADPTYGVVADGVTNTYTALNNLIATAFSAGGGIVYLPAGTYFINSHLTLRTKVYLVGAGVGLTTIKMDSAVAANVLEGPTGVSYFGARHLTLDQNYGGGATSGGGVVLTNCFEFAFVDIEVKQCSNNGILMDSGCHDGRVEGCTVHDVLGHGIDTSGGANGGVYRVAIVGNRVHNHGSAGINLSDAHHCTAAGNVTYNDSLNTSGYGGIRLPNNASFNSVVGNTFYRPSRGIFIASTAGIGNVVSGNVVVEANSQGCLIEVGHQIVSDNYFYNCAVGGGTSALQLSNASYCRVNGNVYHDDRTPKLQTHAIIESGTSDFNEIGPSVIDGFLTAEMSLVGASTNVYKGGLTKTLSLAGKAGTETVFNSAALNSDFRVSGDTRSNVLTVTAATDTVGISAASSGVGQTASFAPTLITFNNAGADVDFRVLGDTDTNLLRCDAGTDRVGIGNGVPSEKLHVTGNTLVTGSVLSNGTAGVGYGTGAGGTVTQLTDKTTGVTLSKTCGRITLSNAALAADTTVSFVLTNTTIAETDVVVLNHLSGGTLGAYTLNAQAAAGSATINVRNVTAGPLGEALVIAFAVVKAVTS